MRVCKLLLCLTLVCLLGRAETLPTLNATQFNFTLDIFAGPIFDNTFAASGNGFSLYSDSNYASVGNLSPGTPIDVYDAGLLNLTETLFPTVLGVFGSSQSFFFGPGGRVVPNDPANYSIANVPGTYSFPATAVASFVACTPPANLNIDVCGPYDAATLPADWTGGFVNVNLSGTETVTVIPGFNNAGQLTYTNVEIVFNASAVPEPEGRVLAGLGLAMVVLVWRLGLRLGKVPLRPAA